MKLHMKSKVISIHGKMEILDENENMQYTVESKAVSIHNKTYLKDALGDEVACIYRKAVSMHETHFVEMSDGQEFQVRTELFHIKNDIIQIEELGWTLRGDFLKHNYEILDENENVIASTHLKWMSMHNIYYIDIMEDSKVDLVVALCVTLQRIMQDRANNAGSGTGAAE